MPSATRALTVGARATDRQSLEAGEEFRERRLALGSSQQHVAVAARVTRNRYGKIERGHCSTLTIAELNRIAAVLGLSASVRIYPAGPPVRDAAQAKRLANFLEPVAPPLTYRVEVALPHSLEPLELRAWDAMLFGLASARPSSWRCGSETRRR